MADSIFYVVEVDLPAASLPEFVPWYAAVHAPHLFQAGFTTCTSYLAVSGGMATVDIYQAPDWSMFEAPAFNRYRGIVFEDVYRPKIFGKVDGTRTVYLHHPLPGVPADNPAHPLDRDWISMWRFPGDAALEERVAAWLKASGAGMVTSLGARNLRLLHRGQDAPTGASKRPTLGLLAEWDTRPPAEAQTAAILPDWLAPLVAPEQMVTALRIYPWPSTPALRAEAEAIVAGRAAPAAIPSHSR